MAKHVRLTRHLRATYAWLTRILAYKDDSSTMSQDTILKSHFTPTRNHKKTMVCRHIISCKNQLTRQLTQFASRQQVLHQLTPTYPYQGSTCARNSYDHLPNQQQHGGFIAWPSFIIFNIGLQGLIALIKRTETFNLRLRPPYSLQPDQHNHCHRHPNIPIHPQKLRQKSSLQTQYAIEGFHFNK